MTTDAVGGIWQYSLDLAAGLCLSGDTVHLATMGPALDPHQRRQADGVAGLIVEETGLPLDWLAEDAQTVRAASAALGRLAQARQADLAHLHTPALAPGLPCPTVVVHHSCVATWWAAVRGGDPPDDFGWRTDLVRQGLFAADAVIAPTRAFAEEIRAVYSLDEAPQAVLNGREPAGEVEHGPAAPEIFTAGRLWDEGKGLAVLDRAAASLAWSVFAAGSASGPNGTHFAPQHLRLLGTLDGAGIRARLKQRPIYAAPAFYEPFGLAILEAAQAGCALVLSGIPTLRELWDGAALFVPPGDDGALAAALRDLGADPALRDRLGQAARLRSRRYTTDAMVAGTQSVHQSAIARAFQNPHAA